MKNTRDVGARLPVISIVTPSYNQGQFLEETIESVLAQDYPHVEYIVINDGSTDNTEEILQRYTGRIRWYSQPNRGQSATINRGFTLATGDIFNWLNSDDYYLPCALLAIAEAYIKNPGSLIAGNVINFDERTGEEALIRQEGITLEKFIDFWSKPRPIWHQPGIFFPRVAWAPAGALQQYCPRIRC